MTNNQLQLVTYEQAKRLKAAGFDWRDGCTSFWYNFFGTITLKRIYAFRNYNHEMCWLAPTVALALKWMRVEKKIRCEVSSNRLGTTWAGGYIVGDVISGDLWQYTAEQASYDQAESALLDELLTLLENGNK